MRKLTKDAFLVRTLAPSEAAECEAIMRSLPDWFGIETSIVQYRRDIEHLETFAAERKGELIGFLALKQHNPCSAEVHVLAVRREWHRHGIGRAMVRHVEELARTRAVELLHVKTLGPSRPNAAYDATRKFYESMGFRPLEENKLWGEANPCLMMVKHLGCGG